MECIEGYFIIQMQYNVKYNVSFDTAMVHWIRWSCLVRSVVFNECIKLRPVLNLIRGRVGGLPIVTKVQASISGIEFCFTTFVKPTLERLLRMWQRS